MRLIALSGKAGSGKNTVAEMLVDMDFRAAYLELAFGDTIKTVAATLTGIHRAHWYDRDFKETFCDKIGMTPRSYLQQLGDKLRSLDKDVFVKALFNRMHATGSYIITDVRFLNEAKAAKAFGAVMVRIDRPGLETGEHASETELDAWDGWDHVITNDGTLDDLRGNVWKTLFHLLNA